MLEQLVSLSNRYGSDPKYVLAGGGNTSFKTDDTLYIKGSGTSLATIKAEDFVSMDRSKLNDMLKKEYPNEDAAREAEALLDIMAARMEGNGEKRPSVETLLHNLFPYKYVLHIHPTLVNALTCSVGAEDKARELFSDSFVWIPAYRPGYALSMLCANKMNEYKATFNKPVQILILQNHGIFIAADSVEEIDEKTNQIMITLENNCEQKPSLEPLDYDECSVNDFKQRIAAMYDKEVYTEFATNKTFLSLFESKDSFLPLFNPFTPDHIVYCKAKFLYLENTQELETLFDEFVEQNGYVPHVICVSGVGAFYVAPSIKELNNISALFIDAVCLAVYTRNFGGYLHMDEDLTDFILNWEMEAYRQKVAAK